MKYFQIPILKKEENLSFVLRCLDFLENFVEKENGFRLMREVKESNKKDEQPLIYNTQQTNLEIILLYIGIIPDTLIEELEHIAKHYQYLERAVSIPQEIKDLEKIYTKLTSNEKLWDQQ